jgi:pimeloyl-ACP methyl ester carboxylesterase
MVLLHGHLLSSTYWRDGGFAQTLADGYTVVLIDALGHGHSDKPSAPAAYQRARRAGEVVAVLDAIEAESFHLVGHSMGGWTAVGLARAIPDRLLSVTLGGWNPVQGIAAGLPAGIKGPVPFARVLSIARATAPELVSWVTAENEPGLRASWEAMDDLDGAAEALLECGRPVLLWSGRDDPRGTSMQILADRYGWKMLWTEGDHLTVVTGHGSENALAVRQAIEKH